MLGYNDGGYKPFNNGGGRGGYQKRNDFRNNGDNGGGGGNGGGFQHRGSKDYGSDKDYDNGRDFGGNRGGYRDNRSVNNQSLITYEFLIKPYNIIIHILGPWS